MAHEQTSPMPRDIFTALGILIDAYGEDLVAYDPDNEPLSSKLDAAFNRVHHWWMQTKREILEAEETSEVSESV